MFGKRVVDIFKYLHCLLSGLVRLTLPSGLLFLNMLLNTLQVLTHLMLTTIVNERYIVITPFYR